MTFPRDKLFEIKLVQHKLWILDRIVMIPIEQGFRGRAFYFDVFSDKFDYNIRFNHNAYELIKELEHRGFLKIISFSGKDDLKEIVTAHGDTVIMVTRYYIKILSAGELESYLGDMIYDYNLSITNGRGGVECVLKLTDRKFKSPALYIDSEFGRNLIWRFKHDSTNLAVFRALLGQGHVERDERGHLIAPKFIGDGMICRDLSEIVRNSGFSKQAKAVFFSECSSRSLILRPKIILKREDHRALLKSFTDAHLKLSAKNRNNKSRSSVD